MVRLGAIISTAAAKSHICFNSSMVRLGGTRKKSSVPLCSFQFQYGAIGSPAPVAHLITPNNVSIPVWCDWEGEARDVPHQVEVVSIPVWCDWEEDFVRGYVAICYKFQFQYGAIGSILYCYLPCLVFIVSIPVWCDWERQDSSGQPAPACFNSSMVRLGASPTVG